MLLLSVLLLFHLIRSKNNSLGLRTKHKNFIMLLVDHNISNETLNECSNILENANISIISFGCNPLNDTQGVQTYVVTDLNSAIKGVMNNYK